MRMRMTLMVGTTVLYSSPPPSEVNPANVFFLAFFQMSLTGVMTTQMRKTLHTAVSLRRTEMTTGTGRLIMV